ncbi:hypothetical protein [Janthinobacterium sp. MDT1-19]|uniref:hypothetical protein n=1 Tax=Janthinobacterium sp. MDT1-19 TaxID=1259339 RepID=UPI003F26B868
MNIAQECGRGQAWPMLLLKNERRCMFFLCCIWWRRWLTGKVRFPEVIFFVVFLNINVIKSYKNF